MELQVEDTIVKDVILKFAERSQKGVEVYGTTLDENDVDDFLLHAQEEAMDFVLYLQKLRSDLKRLGLMGLKV